LRPAYRLIYALPDRIIAHSQAARSELMGHFGVSSHRIAVIPHGDYSFADTGERISPSEAKQWLGVPAQGRLILAFGAMREYKGIPDLIDAFARVSRTFPDSRLAIAGRPQGVDPEAYRDQARRLGISSQVVIRPEYVPFEHIGHYFQAADVAVFPYRRISQSGALQLAYAFAKPVVVTRVGAFPETVQEGENGLVVAPADPPALADALVRLLGMSSEELSRMGLQSQKLAESRYSWEDIAHTTAALYARLLSRRAA
jgi:glycosyltransferase involved in cell wall biosynthesis